MMRTVRSMGAAVVLSLCPLWALAASAQEQLRAFVANVSSATGTFSQQTVGVQGSRQPAQSGVFSFQRPGKFKWSVQKPYAQLILSDGKQVYQYDPDLAQVAVRRFDQAIGRSPAAILFGSGSLEQSFDLTSLPPKDQMDWLRAKPHSADAGFSRIDIGFKNNVPARIELLDSFGQTTQVELGAIVPNALLPKGEFAFQPPAGVDVVKM